MFSRSPLFILLTLVGLTGCDGQSSPEVYDTTGSNGIGVPARIRGSLAIDPSQVTGTISVNGQNALPMQLVDGRYQVEIPNISANSQTVVSLNFSERQPNGDPLTLASADQIAIDVGSQDTVFRITEDQFNYSHDQDLDTISNIIEREQGTDPFVPENTTTRNVRIRFNIPERINEPSLVQVIALIGDIPRPWSRSNNNNEITVTALVSHQLPVSIDFRLILQLDQEVVIARACTASTISTQPGCTIEAQAADLADLDLQLTDAVFDFSIDTDGDGISNLDEIQSGTDPFTVN